MDWKPKDWVEHSAFGVGQVSEDRGDRLDIHFVNAGMKTLLKSAAIVSANAPSPDFKFPNHKAKFHASKFKIKGPAELPPLDFDHLVACFKSHFPEGFDGQDFHVAEREYKEEAVAIITDKLGNSAFEKLLRDGHCAGVCDIAKHVLRRTNLVHPIEKAKFTDAIDDISNQERFSVALFDLLYGSAEMERRFTGFSNILSEMGVNTWTAVTYYQFLATKGKWMFMKPVVTKRMADSLRVSLNYKPEPNWLTYSKVQELADRLDAELKSRGLKPHSGIDVQGFIWASIKIEEGKY